VKSDIHDLINDVPKLGMERRTQAATYAARVFGDHHDREDHGGGPGN
jgi:hypothetical protein